MCQNVHRNTVRKKRKKEVIDSTLTGELMNYGLVTQYYITVKMNELELMKKSG